MYLIGYHDDAPLITEVSKSGKRLPVPEYTCGVVWIGEDEHLTPVIGHLRKIVEVHGIGAVGILMQGIEYHLPAVALRSETEGMVYRRLDNHLVTRLCEHIYHHAYALDDAGNVRQPLPLDIEAMMVVEPCHYSRPIVFWLYGVAEYRMLHALAQSINNKWRSLEVHVCHPQGQKICSAITLGKHIGLECAGRRAVYDFVEVVFHFFCRGIDKIEGIDRG